MKRFWALLLVHLLLLSGCAVMDFGEATPHTDEKPALEQKENEEKADAKKPDQDDPYLDLPPEKIEKDKNITYAQRAEFFDFAQKYRLDHIPGIYKGEYLYPSYLANYVGYVYYKELEVVGVDQYRIPGTLVAKVASEWFGLEAAEYNKDQIWRKPNDLLVMAELVSYQETQVEGKTVVTAKFFAHRFNELDYIDDPQNQGFSYFPGMKDYDENSIKAYELAKKEGSDFYSAAKKLVLNGVLNDNKNGHLCEVTYETIDGKTPSRLYIREFEYAE